MSLGLTGPRFLIAIVVLLVHPSFVHAQETPDWAQQTFHAPAEQVYQAALKSILQQKHDITKADDPHRTVDSHVGTTAWSWGYNMQLAVVPAVDGKAKVTISILRSGGKAVSWGSGKKEVKKIFAGIESALNSDIQR